VICGPPGNIGTITSQIQEQLSAPCMGGPTTTTAATGMPAGCSSDITGTYQQKLLTALKTLLNGAPLAKPLLPLLDPCVSQKILTVKNAGGAAVGAGAGAIGSIILHEALTIAAAHEANIGAYAYLAWEVQWAAAECGTNQDF
jgi:hypothetical protein